MRITLITLTHFISFFFLQQNGVVYVDPQIANLLFEAGQSSTNFGYNMLGKLKTDDCKTERWTI